ncbi:DUF6257 family protein [Streptomyces genisteinicus]|uniref:Uncharacterized protein n=1 Tax=Streptomyces genisteinicus TaxID=2768068 RepID=A0A7H0HV96_9ACTN|nr:DUF6257 family protein [Streptomyces genisteinicus]QNP64462.1 hypothetical protein IAG43_17115 [Streptomyces genisteinicus]
MPRYADEPRLTAGETASVAYYVARMAKRGLAGEHVYQGDLERKVERVIDRARKREERDAKKNSARK